MEFLRKTIKVGNSSGVLLPKKLLGAEVKIIVIDTPVNIKKEAIKILDEYLDDALGVYITSKKPAEVLAVSGMERKILSNEKMKIIIVPLPVIRKDIKIKPELARKLFNAEVIFNKSLLAELKKEISDVKGYNKVITSLRKPASQENERENKMQNNSGAKESRIKRAIRRE